MNDVPIVQGYVTLVNALVTRDYLQDVGSFRESVELCNIVQGLNTAFGHERNCKGCKVMGVDNEDYWYLT